MRWLTIFELDMLLKRKLYNLFNAADGKALVWDARHRRYVAHIEPNRMPENGNPFGPEAAHQLLDGQRVRR